MHSVIQRSFEDPFHENTYLYFLFNGLKNSLPEKYLLYARYVRESDKMGICMQHSRNLFSEAKPTDSEHSMYWYFL